MRAVLLLFLMLATPAAAQHLAPFKDELFSYPGVFIEEDGGAYRMVDYDSRRDIHGRDQIPEKRAHARFVSLGVSRAQRDLEVRTPAGPVAHFTVGRRQDASLIVVYLHGRGGNRHQGVDDHTFGGNFNRLKNLAVRSGGLYLVPDFTDFEQKGANEVAGLIRHYAAASPGAPVFVACGSMGGMLCWRLARDEGASRLLGGLLLLGSLWDGGFLDSPAFRRKVPVFLGQGSLDRVFPVERMEEFYHAIRRRAPDYPVSMVRFETGSHGTPIRMTDWRETINWMLAARPQR